LTFLSRSDERVENASPLVFIQQTGCTSMSPEARLCLKKVMIAAAAACMWALTCARAQEGDLHGAFSDDMHLCLTSNLFFSESTNPPPIRVEGAPLERLFVNYSRFYHGSQAPVDLVLAYERGDVILLVPFAEDCATSLPRKIDAESWQALSGAIWRPLGSPPPAWLG
jgi:hypothetical protein